jgi:glucose-6-phosphate isomerase/transaldolase/glucose-6-phosphate isomerase
MNTQSRDIRLVHPQRLEAALRQGLTGLEQDQIVRRIWSKDFTVWKPEDREITSRLGWLTAPETAVESIPELEVFAGSVRGLGLTRAVILGMGGSSLAPEVFARLFPTGPSAVEIEILDTTEPGDVADAAARFPAGKTLFVVSSKSGTTSEMIALLSFFYDRAVAELGDDHAGRRFVAVTDPGTPLEALARERHFRRVFLGRPDIGGRFSALSAFGLLPAALKGVDLHRLLAPARDMARACRVEKPEDNPGALLGTILGVAARSGLDKLTLLMPAHIRPFGSWLEQLLAESTGKEGRGIVPVVEDRPGPAAGYSRDRLFVEIGAPEAARAKSAAPRPEGTSSPLIGIPFEEPYDLAGHFFLWEFATAVAGRFIGVNPFDQPDVESAKKRTREVLSSAGVKAPAAEPDRRPFSGGLRAGEPAPAGGDVEAAFKSLLAGRKEGAYLAILAFLPRSAAVEELLSGLAAGVRFETGLPVTVGFGPRYLHSTGQLHKGDGGHGLFLMLVAADLPGLAIPEFAGAKRPAADFGSLFKAQAEGDALALTEKGRKVLTLELSSPVEKGLASLSSFLG